MIKYYFVTEVDDSGEVLGKLDSLFAEGLAYRIGQTYQQVEWSERGQLKERNYVCILITKHEVTQSVGCQSIAIRDSL